MKKYTIEQVENHVLYHNENGTTIGVTSCPILFEDGYAFKDPEKTGVLVPYADWRLDADTRAKDLAARLSTEEIAGLMIYSPHQMLPGLSVGPFISTYDGKTLEESGKEPFSLTDQQKKMLTQDHIRHILIMLISNAEMAAKWNNNLQALAESLPHSIPVNISSDPRHGAGKASAEFKSQAADVSKWPEGLGLAATFSEDLCRAYGEAVSREYRALGITTALSPQIDLGSEPRWMRFEDTFGGSPEMVTKFGKIYCDALQTTEGSPDGWGKKSVCAMAKHWPGGGPCEAGRDAHYAFGKYAVYPGDNAAQHMQPFLDGAFRLDGPTQKTASVMPYYTVSWNLDTKDGKNVGNSYSHHIISDLLRDKYGYDGVVCTDWGITADPNREIDSFGSRCFGTEHLSEAERHLMILENGVDQFGGNSDIRPVLEAYRLGCERHGQAWMRFRFEQSAVRLLRNIFRCGLFDNAYLNPEESKRIVGCQEFCEKGFEAQLKSVVMLKNKQLLPLKPHLKVYVPDRRLGPGKTFFRTEAPAQELPGASRETVERYFEWASSPEEADAALVFIESPLSDGYSIKDREQGGNGYVPVSLQYRPYTAKAARTESIAGGDFRETFTNRSYAGKTGTARNEYDLDLVLQMKKAMPDKPVIVCIRMHNPAVLSELEPFADAILTDFGVQQEALLKIISGESMPQGRLPIQLPKDMETAEKHCEDVPLDLEAYTDSEGNVYDFGFGLDWNGVIEK